MAGGIPVAASRVAAGGVDAVANDHFLVASTPEEYVNAVLRILEDPAYRQQLSAAGRQRVLSHHAWDGSMQRLDGIINRCLRAQRDSRGDVAGNEERAALVPK